MSRMILAVSMFLLAGQVAVLAEPVTLTEKMTDEYYANEYEPLRVEAERADSKGDYAVSAAKYVLAAEAHSISAIRAALYRNAAYEMLKQAQTGIGPKFGLKYLLQSEAMYAKASATLEKADEIGGRDASRSLTRKHIKMGLGWLRHLQANPELLIDARKDL